MMSRIRIALGVAALAGLAACNEPLLPESPYEVRVDTLTMYAFNGTPRTVPSALNVAAGQAVPLSTSFTFDVAIDINAEGRAVVYPVQLLVSGLGGRTGIQVKPAGSFESIEKAPVSGYSFDTPAVVGEGEVVVIQTAAESCPYYTPVIYAKLAVDSIIPAERRMRVRFSANPNCGYISLRPGRSRE
jgi:hypothetical protein